MSRERPVHLRRNGLCGVLGLCAGLVVSEPAFADGPWSITAYGGPSSTKFVTQILSGNFDVNGGMVGLAVDRKLINLGSGISFGAEAQLTQFFGKYTYGTGALGVGFRFDRFPWSRHLPTTMAIFSGPSYAPDAPLILDPQPHQDPKFLNFVGIEIAFAVSDKWDAGLRVYHRSGAWGTYSNTADVGSMIGFAIRRRF
jgi:hypothetical protein